MTIPLSQDLFLRMQTPSAVITFALIRFPGAPPPTSTRALHLFSASTEAAAHPALAMSAFTPTTAPQEAVATTQEPTGSSTSVVGSPTSMSPLEPLLTTPQKAMNTSGDA